MIYAGIDAANDKHALKSSGHYRYNIILLRCKRIKDIEEM